MKEKQVADEVPSLEQVMDSLRADADAASAPEPSPEAGAAPVENDAPAAAPAEREPVSGLRLKEDPPPKQAAPAAPPAPEVPDVGKLREEMETLGKRLTDTQSWGHAEANRRAVAEEVARILQEKEQRDAEMYRQAQQVQPPAIDKDKLHEDPEYLLAAMQQLVEFGSASTLARLGPYIQAINHMQGTFPVFAQTAERAAARDAAELVQKMGFDDFETVLPEIRDTLTRHGGQYASNLLSDPEQLKNAYLIVRSQKGLPMAGAPAAKPPVVTTAKRTQAPNNGAKKRVAELSPMAAEMARKLGIGGMEVTEGDLERVGLMGGR